MKNEEILEIGRKKPNGTLGTIGTVLGVAGVCGIAGYVGYKYYLNKKSE